MKSVIKLTSNWCIDTQSLFRVVIELLLHTQLGVGGIAKGTAQSPKLIFDSRVCGLFTQSGSIIYIYIHHIPV